MEGRGGEGGETGGDGREEPPKGSAPRHFGFKNEEVLAQRMAPLKLDRPHIKISSRSSYRCGQRHRGVGFRRKSSPGTTLPEAQGGGVSRPSGTIPCWKY